MMRILNEMNKPARCPLLTYIYFSKTEMVQINGFVYSILYMLQKYNTLDLKEPTGQIDRPESSTYRSVDLKFLFSLFNF
jgi:hypothetical protein